MTEELKLYHKILPILFIPVCGFAVINFGWLGYATLTERPGLNGNLYYYYQLTRPQFYIFNFISAFTALGLIVFQMKFLINKKPKYLIVTFWIFSAFIIFTIVTEIYLSKRLIGKG
jgi:hypothetical protein